MKFTQFSRLGSNRSTPRLWIETNRLESIGFAVGTSFQISRLDRGLRLTPTSDVSRNTVSLHRLAGGTCPIIDINSRESLSPLAGFEALKIRGSFKAIDVIPTIRAAAILSRRHLNRPFRVLDVFAGGGTMSAALVGNPDFEVVAALELEAKYANLLSLAHPNAHIFIGDARDVHPNEYPQHDVLICGIPCTSFSPMGIAKNGLKGKSELGESGCLFIPILNLVACRMPMAVVIENVPHFGNSLAGQMLVKSLQELGYNVSTTVLNPHDEWDEACDRRRWVCVATLASSFQIAPPMIKHTRSVAEYLDPQNDAQDRADAERIAATVAGLKRHNERHAAVGHGFSMTVLDGTEDRIPVIPRNYHKINSSGAFVKTHYGPRMLRQSEIERIHGHRVETNHYATAVEVLGQGVQTRVFQRIFQQLASFLKNDASLPERCTSAGIESQMNLF